jgi:hypothetical protein
MGRVIYDLATGGCKFLVFCVLKLGVRVVLSCPVSICVENGGDVFFNDILNDRHVCCLGIFTYTVDRLADSGECNSYHLL